MLQTSRKKHRALQNMIYFSSFLDIRPPWIWLLIRNTCKILKYAINRPSVRTVVFLIHRIQVLWENYYRIYSKFLINFVCGQIEKLVSSVVDPNLFWASPIRIRHYFVRIRVLPSTSKKVRKTLISNMLWLLFDFFSMKIDVNQPKTYFLMAFCQPLTGRKAGSGSGSQWYGSTTLLLSFEPLY